MKRARVADVVPAINKEMAAVSGMIVNPEAFPVQRFREYYAVTPTAIAKPKSNFKVIWDQVDQTESQLPTGQWAAFSFRDPVRATIQYVRNKLGNIEYDALFNMENGSVLSPVAPYENKDLKPLLYTATSGSTNKPHGPYLGCGESQNKVGVWVDATPSKSASIQFKFTPQTTPVTANADYSIIPYKWQGGQWLERTATAGVLPLGSSTPPTLTVSLEESGYWSFGVNFGAVNLGYNVAIHYITRTLTVWAHHPMGDLFPYNLAQVNGMRVLALGTLFQNEAADMYKQGSIVQLQASKVEDWYETWASQNADFFDSLMSAGTSENHLLSKGAYAYLKPSSSSDFDWIEDIKHGSTAGGYGSVSSTWFPLVNKSDYLIMAASSSGVNSGDGTFSLRWAIEFKTQNAWIDQEPPTILPQAFEEGVEAVAGMEQFYENAVHWGDIFRTIGRVASVGGKILSGFGPYGVAASQVANVVGGVANGVGQLVG